MAAVSGPRCTAVCSGIILSPPTSCPPPQPGNQSPLRTSCTRPERRNKLIYRVTYFGARINLEMFHAITDGNGGLLYLKSIVRNYLALRHPGEMENVPSPNSASPPGYAQDSSDQF